MEKPSSKGRSLNNMSQIKEFLISPTFSSEIGTLITWNEIDWKARNSAVSKLRRSIYAKTSKLASCENAVERSTLHKQLRLAQTKMLYSYDNLLVSVGRVTQLNDGKKTPGFN
jgi:RNA-directed DNA polymerase